jgi:L-2-hydroxyglutarate oxidase LhgO
MGSEHADAVVIGAGVIGLAVARQLALAGREVLVLESRGSFGQEISSRNSGVIHAGIYYPPGSLKARCCIRGKQLLYDYCERRRVAARRCGKLIIATSEVQLEGLRALHDNAVRSGLGDLQWLDQDQVAEMEPDIRASAGLLSPSTGIVDVHELMLALIGDMEGAGGSLVTRCKVLRADPVASGIELQVDDGSGFNCTAHTVVNAAGHGAEAIARGTKGLGESHIPRILPIRGHYYEYSGKLPFSRLIYPMPEESTLGVHVTMDIAGQFRFGPDAEHAVDVDYRFDDSRRGRFVEAVRDWYPALDETRLHPGFVGVRPNLQRPGQGRRDFIVSGQGEHGIEGLVNLFGIDSPGLTACLALAEEVAARLSEQGRAR